jgi:hypothetical protein
MTHKKTWVELWKTEQKFIIFIHSFKMPGSWEYEEAEFCDLYEDVIKEGVKDEAGRWKDIKDLTDDDYQFFYNTIGFSRLSWKNSFAKLASRHKNTSVLFVEEGFAAVSEGRGPEFRSEKWIVFPLMGAPFELQDAVYVTYFEETSDMQDEGKVRAWISLVRNIIERYGNQNIVMKDSPSNRCVLRGHGFGDERPDYTIRYSLQHKAKEDRYSKEREACTVYRKADDKARRIKLTSDQPVMEVNLQARWMKLSEFKSEEDWDHFYRCTGITFGEWSERSFDPNVFQDVEVVVTKEAVGMVANTRGPNFDDKRWAIEPAEGDRKSFSIQEGVVLFLQAIALDLSENREYSARRELLLHVIARFGNGYIVASENTSTRIMRNYGFTDREPWTSSFKEYDEGVGFSDNLFREPDGLRSNLE